MSYIIKFFNEVAFELSNVKWPTKQELFIYGLTVFFVVLVSSIILSVMDFSFGYLVQTMLLW